jgi:hypothetical protein
MEIVLHRLSKVLVPSCNDEADSIKRSRLKYNGDRARAQAILLEAQNYYSAMFRFRQDRERNKRYNYGDQWGDIVCVDGKKMTEEQYILSQGNIPLKTNLIRRLVRNVIGMYRSQATEPTCTARDRDEQQQAETMSTVLQYNMQLNRMTELYARTVEEYLISGLAVHRKWYGWRNDKMECWTDYVQPNNFFVDNNMRDFRAWDCSCVGEIHDLSFDQLCTQFAQTPDDYVRLAEIYRLARDYGANARSWEDFGYGRDCINTDFLSPRDPSRCRVIEVWRKENKPRYRCHDLNNGEIFKIEIEDYDTVVRAENEKRLAQAQRTGIPYEEIPFVKAEWFMDSYWYYYYLSPLGDILAEGETPYEHKSHPYVFKAYPFIDGEIHSFVSDVIDQQRYTNRLITLNDWVIRASAKGVLLIPDECIPKGMSPEEFADTWARFNGVVVYTPGKTGAVPTQVSNNSTNIGIHEMLNLQLKFFEDISGVNGALQGKPGYSGTSAALYSQQTQNATTSLLDVLDSFQEFIRDAAYKDVKNIQQFYDQKRTYNIAGRASTQVVYDPMKIRDVEMDISVIPSQATPAYRAISNDFLMQIFNQKAISLEQMLQAGDFPFADALLQSIKSQKEQLAQGNTPEGLSPELMQQAQQGANPETMQLLQRTMGSVA